MEKKLNTVLESIRLKASEMNGKEELSNDEVHDLYFNGNTMPEAERLEIALNVENGQPVASSREVAERFEKQHKHVLRDIDELKKDVPNFGQMFFNGTAPDSYGRPQRVYLMNRDGFALLTMGFTNKKALAWKLKYIDAFNRMEQNLRERKEKPKSKTLILSEALLLANSVIEEERQKNAELENKVAQLKPASDYAHAILLSDESMTTTQIAQNYGLTARKLNSILKELEIQRKVNDQWVLYAKYQGKGYVVGIPVDIGDNRTKENTRWTRMGQAFLYKQLKNAGYIPVNEQLNMFAVS